MTKYLKVMFGNKGAEHEYKIDTVNEASLWNPDAKKGRDFGGFNFSSEDKILRWLHRGDTLYDVKIPEDALVIDVTDSATPHGVFRTNKIIVSNPRKVTDEMALHFYEISTIPEIAYYKSLAVVSVMNYQKTALKIIKDKVNKDNIDLVLKEFNDFISYGRENDSQNLNGFLKEVYEYLDEIKSDLLISRFIDKEPYIKDITNDKIINITGESGSGKSYFSNKYLKDNNYIVIDTDIVFSDKLSENKESLELRNIFKSKSKDYLFTNFDDFYLQVLDYFKYSNKTLVIDSAQYRNIHDYSILKGKIIVMRTSIETCYERTLQRWKFNNEYNEEKYQQFAKKKLEMFKWYKSLNKFLIKINNL